MKRILPLLAKPQYYQRLKAGRARGGEAVILVENVRSFYDVLSRHYPPMRAFPAARAAVEAPGGLKSGTSAGLRPSGGSEFFNPAHVGP
jgi:hypothetical protein